MFQDVVADERAPELENSFVDVDTTFKADAKSTKTAEPRVRPLDDPSAFSQATPVPGPALCDHPLDGGLTKLLARRLGVVTAISVEDFWL